MPDLSQLSIDTRRGISAAELHGAVCGIAVSNPEQANPLALVELLGPDALMDQQAVSEYMEQAIAELTAADLSFQLLLADASDIADLALGEPDLQSLPEALSQWCAAFVAGLLASLPVPEDAGEQSDQWDALQQLGPDSQEIVSDLLAIAEIEHDAAELQEDEMETALTELTEYVRVAVLLLLAPPPEL